STNAPDTLYVTVNVRCTLESSENVLIDLYIDFVAADGAITQVNDQVMLST
ncbi:hypothetical protein LCGC14_2064650, partial [marine sediment metagenome]